MAFNLNDTVIKPGLGICKIKAIRKMDLEGKPQQFYVLQSGEVKVMVPFTFAHSGGLRYLIDEEGIEKLYDFLRDPIPLPEDDTEMPEHFPLNVEDAKEEIKKRDPFAIAVIAKNLFYKSKICELPKADQEIFQSAMAAIAEEIAHIQHTTRQKILLKMRSVLTEGRKSRKQSYLRT